MPDQDHFQSLQEILDAMEETGLIRYVVAGEPPVVVLGPGDQVDITFEIDVTALPDWERIILSPSEHEPPLWTAQIHNISTSDEIPEKPEHHLEVKDAVEELANTMREQGVIT